MELLPPVDPGGSSQRLRAVPASDPPPGGPAPGPSAGVIVLIEVVFTG